MKAFQFFIIIAVGVILPTPFSYPQENTFPWLEYYNPGNSIENRIPAPEGYERVEVTSGSFGEWLRYLPLKKEGSPVLLFNGIPRGIQSSHHSVIDIDVGNQNLQQCADAIMRLRSEYLYSTNNFESMHFNTTSGTRIDFTKYIKGDRPFERDNKIAWKNSSSEQYDSSYKILQKYMRFVFVYAGTASLEKELHKVDNVLDMKIGDVFIRGGHPGHADIVVDMAMNKETGKKIFLVAQSFMPAQDIHILKNSENLDLNPWYEVDFGEI